MSGLLQRDFALGGALLAQKSVAALPAMLCALVLFLSTTGACVGNGGRPDRPPVRLPQTNSGASRTLPDTGRRFLSEQSILQAIEQDLQKTDENNRPFLRYLSLAHLYNAGETESRLNTDRIALSKLLNSLSWHQKIWNPEPLHEPKTLFRIDLRRFRWTPALWNNILVQYPYAIHTEEAERIEKLSGAPDPYMRADWFAAKVSCSPLYEQILGLPRTSAEMEKLLGVEASLDLDQERDIGRAGVRCSLETGHGRIMERHVTPFGAYWKSFDFPDTQGSSNIFNDPIQLRVPRIEAAFNLPNGMQAYFAEDSILPGPDEAAVTRGRTEINARACMSCHRSGIEAIKDEVRPTLLTQAITSFDRNKALALYPEQSALEEWLAEDNGRFHRAQETVGLQASGGSLAEPIDALVQEYEGPVSRAKIAAEAGVDLGRLREQLESNRSLAASGFVQVVAGSDGLSREVWEDYFPDVVEDLHPTQSTAIPFAISEPENGIHLLNPANNHYYQAVTVPGGDITWTDANDAAKTMAFRGMQGHLATLTSAEENQFVANHFPQAVQRNYWIGGYQDRTAPDFREPDGGWRWVTGEPWAFTNWYPGEPNNQSGSDDYVQVTSEGRWNDQKNDDREGRFPGYVVEFEPARRAQAAPGVIPHYDIMDLGPSVSEMTTASGLNSAGQVAGSVRKSGHQRAFLAKPQSPLIPVGDMRTLDGSASDAAAINSLGRVAGSSQLQGDTAWHAFRTIPPGPAIDLGTLGGANSFALAMNRPGQVAGYSETRDGALHAFRTGLNQPINPRTDDLGTLGGAESRAMALNDSGEVVGTSLTSGGHAHAFRTGPNRAINHDTDDLKTLGGSSSSAWGINNARDVVGSSLTTGDNTTHAFLFSGTGPMHDLGTLPGFNASTARGINRSGQVVGYCETLPSAGSSGPTAFLYVNGTLQDLNSLLLPGSGWILEKALAINDNGKVVGWGLFNGGTHAFLLTPR